MQDLWDFLNQNQNIADLILKILTFVLGSSLVGVIGWWINRWWIKKRRLDLTVFDVITDPKRLLPKLYGTAEGDNRPLADHNILYQQRHMHRSIQEELRKELNKRRYLLIIAPTGYGKTREAGVLAQGLMAEGYRVVRIRPGWLDEPNELPAELGNQRSRILLLLDDLTGLFRSGAHIQSPLMERLPVIRWASFHDRLLKAIDAFELLCGQNEVRVIAAARSEPSEWAWLKFHKQDELWRRFGQPFELPAPSHSTIIELLEASSSMLEIDAQRGDFAEIAAMNTGAFRNVVQNIRRIVVEEEQLSAIQYLPTLYGSWRESYEIVIDHYPLVEKVYDAIDILQQAKIRLYLPLVENLSLLLCTGNKLQKIFQQIQIRRTLKYLIYEANILPQDKYYLIPHDGQIEAKSLRLNWQLFSSGITYAILNLAYTHREQLAESLINYGMALLEKDQLDMASKIFEDVNKFTLKPPS